MDTCQGHTATEWQNIGSSHYEYGRYERALEAFNCAVTLDRNNAVAWANRGMTHMVLKNYQQALADADRAYAINPDGDHVDRDLQVICCLLLGDFQRALRESDWLLQWHIKASQNKNNPFLRELMPHPGLYLHRGMAYAGLEKYLQAIDDFNQAEKLYNTSDYHQFDPIYYQAIYYQRGNSHLKLKNCQQALADYDRALDEDQASDNMLHQNPTADVDLDILRKNRGEAYRCLMGN